jgi:thiamine kinase-like enzyme
VHGDLTPWNLRRTPRGLVLFDWESTGWGEPGSDLALYRRSCDEVRRPWHRRRGHR